MSSCTGNPTYIPSSSGVPVNNDNKQSIMTIRPLGRPLGLDKAQFDKCMEDATSTTKDENTIITITPKDGESSDTDVPRTSLSGANIAEPLNLSRNTDTDYSSQQEHNLISTTLHTRPEVKSPTFTSTDTLDHSYSSRHARLTTLLNPAEGAGSSSHQSQSNTTTTTIFIINTDTNEPLGSTGNVKVDIAGSFKSTHSPSSGHDLKRPASEDFHLYYHKKIKGTTDGNFTTTPSKSENYDEDIEVHHTEIVSEASDRKELTGESLSTSVEEASVYGVSSDDTDEETSGDETIDDDLKPIDGEDEEAEASETTTYTLSDEDFDCTSSEDSDDGDDIYSDSETDEELCCTDCLIADQYWKTFKRDQILNMYNSFLVAQLTEEDANSDINCPHFMGQTHANFIKEFQIRARYTAKEIANIAHLRSMVARTMLNVEVAHAAELEAFDYLSPSESRGHLCTKLIEKNAHLRFMFSNSVGDSVSTDETPCKCSLTLFRERIHLLKTLEIRHAYVLGFNGKKFIPRYAHEYKNQTISQMLPDGNAAIKFWRTARVGNIPQACQCECHWRPLTEPSERKLERIRRQSRKNKSNHRVFAPSNLRYSTISPENDSQPLVQKRPRPVEFGMHKAVFKKTARVALRAHHQQLPLDEQRRWAKHLFRH